MTRIRNLSSHEIEVLLCKYPYAKKTAVENFLSSVANCELKLFALANLKKDALLYNWNLQTELAIAEGINLAGQNQSA